MFKRPLYIFCGLALLLVVAVLILQSTLGSRIKVAVGGLFLPMFGLSSSLDSGIQKAAEKVTPRRVLNKEINDLRAENQRLRVLRQQAEEVFLENGRLRAMLGREALAPWKMKMAKVVGRDPANWWRMVHIDLGSRDGITNDLPVITPDGYLVGKIGEAGPTRSQVVLVGNPNCPVSVLVQESREHGIIAPTRRPVDSSIVELGYLSRNSILKPDQLVVTSGNGAIFPPGIPVGRLIDERSEGQGLYTVARVKLAMEINQLDEVWVLLP